MTSARATVARHVSTKVFAVAAAAFLCSFSAYAYRVSAWIPPWDSNALTSMQLHGGSLDESNPAWYSLDANGGIVKNWNAEDPALRAALTGTRLIPTIQNYVSGSFNASVVLNLIATAESREVHAEALRQLVVMRAFDGIDIDYESLPQSAKANFSAFVALLAQKLHASNKTLSVTISANVNSNDWTAIGAAADSVKIMAYDNHWPGGTAGAITPLDWLDSVVTYAESHIAPEKVMIGLPWYGYDWVGTNATNVSFASGMQTALSNGVTPSRDVNGELTFAYAGHVVYFQDAESYARKVDAVLAKHSRIGGFAHWRAGVEDPATWTKVASMRNGSTSGATPEPKPPTPTRRRAS
jgi:spore germination protein YaaH